MQTLAENRWEDFNWIYRNERFSHWGQGISWIEEPELDPLGIDEREDMFNMNTIPRKGDDLSYYLWRSHPIPEKSLESFCGVPPVVHEEVHFTKNKDDRVWMGNTSDTGNTSQAGFNMEPIPVPV